MSQELDAGRIWERRELSLVFMRRSSPSPGFVPVEHGGGPQIWRGRVVRIRGDVQPTTLAFDASTATVDSMNQGQL